jgi:ParB family chromosome partitioning protein
MEEAEGYQRLALEFHLTQQEIADRVGKERATVANALRLLHLQAEIRKMISNSMISVGHAKVLLGISTPQKQLKLAQKIHKENLSVRATEKLAAKINAGDELEDDSSPKELSARSRLLLKLSEDLQKSLGTKVAIDDDGKGKGRLTIYYYSDDGLNGMAERLKKQ